MGKKRVFLYGAALVLAGCVGLAGFRLASGQELYKAPTLELWEGQADYDLLAKIEYDASQYELRVDDPGGFDVDRFGEYWVGYVLTQKAGEQADLLPVAQAAELPEAPDPVTGADPDPVTGADSDPVTGVDPTPEPVVDPTPEPVVDPTPEPAVDPIPEPVVDPTPEPAVDPTPEPAVDPTPEPAVDPTPEPAVDPTPDPGTSQAPDAVETELPLEPPQPEAVHFKRLVIVKPAIRYEETLRMELGDPAGAAQGITAEIDNFDFAVGDFDPNEVGEYKVTYTLIRRDAQKVLRQFERWVQVTLPDVEFPVYEPTLVAPADPTTAEAEFWLEGITYNENRYTLRLKSDPADLEPNCDQAQRLQYELWEGDPDTLPAVDAASAMFADPSAGGFDDPSAGGFDGPSAGGFDGPSAGDGFQSVEVGLQPAGDGDPSAPKLAAVFGRDVYTTGEMEEEPKESEKPEDRTLAIVAPPLVIYLEDVDPDNPEPIDLLDGVEVVDEATGDPVAEAVVAVSDPGGLADAVASGSGGSGFLNGGMGDPGMDGPGPGAGDPVLDEPAMTGYNILDPTALTEGDYEVVLTAADPETGDLITGVRSVSVQPRAVPSGTGFAIGFSNPDAQDSVSRVAWVDKRMTNNGNDTDPIWNLDQIHTRLRSAIDEFYEVLSPNGYTDPDTGRTKYQAVNTTGHLTIYLFGNVTLTQDDVNALRAFTFTRSPVAINNPSKGNTGVYLEWPHAELRFHNAPGARLHFGNGVDGLELPEGVNLPQGFYWNVATSGTRYIAGIGNGYSLRMAPREYGGGRLVMTGGPSRYGNSTVSTNFTYEGSKGAGNTATPTHVVAAGLLYKDIRSTGDWRNRGTLSMTVTPPSGINVQTIMTHALFVPGDTSLAHPGQDGRVDVTLARGSGETDVYLGYTNVTGNKVEVGNSWCNLYLADGAKARNVYGRAMAYNAVGGVNANHVGDMTNGLWVETRAGTSQITGTLNGFHGLKVIGGSTLSCGGVDYSNYGSTGWGGELQLEGGATLNLTNRNATQKAGKLIVFGGGATLAVPTENNNNSAPKPLVLEKSDAAAGLGAGKKLNLKGSQAGYTGRSYDVLLRFNTAGQANKDHYQPAGGLSAVDEVRVRTVNNVGEVYLYALIWRLNYKNGNSYAVYGDYATLKEALEAMRDHANTSRHAWRLNLRKDYTLTFDDTNTLRSLAINGKVSEAVFMGKPEGTTQPTLTVTDSANEFRMPGWGNVNFVMRDFRIRDNTTGGKGFYIAAEGSPLTIEGTWSGNDTTHLCGGYVGTGASDSYSIAGNQHFIVRNEGTGWASIAGGHCFNKTSGTITHGTMNGAVVLEVEAKGWSTNYGITLGNSYMGTVVGRTVMNGGGRLILKGNLTGGPVSHASITKNMNVSGNDTLGADAVIELNGVTLGTNVVFNEFASYDLANGLGGSGKLILSVVQNSSLGGDGKIRHFDKFEVSAGKTFTFVGDGGWVDYKNGAGRDGKLILHNGSTVVLQRTASSDTSSLKVKSIELPDGSATISANRVNNTGYAPVYVQGNPGLTVTQAGAKLTLKHTDSNNTAEVDDMVLKFANVTLARNALAHLTPGFANAGEVVLKDNGALIKVSKEHVALDITNASGVPTGSYEGHPTLAAALTSLKARKAQSPHWRVSLMADYTMTDADHQALEELDNNNALDGVQTVYLAGRRLNTGTIYGLTISKATNGTKHLDLPLDNTSRRARIVLKDFNWNNGTDRCAIVAQGRALTIEGQWSGTEYCHVGGGLGYYEAQTPDSNNTRTHNGTTDVTVRNTGSGWASIVGGNIFSKDGGTNSWASSTVTGATRVTVHASWPIGLGITPGSLCQGYDCENKLEAGGTATITGTLGRGSYTADGKTIQGHITHFGLATTVRLRTFTANGDVTINLGSDTAAFSTTNNLPVNVAKYGGNDILSATNTPGDRAYPNGSGKLILSINGNTTIPADSEIKTFDKLEVAAGKKLTLLGDGGWVNYNGRAGKLILHNGSSVELQKVSGGEGSTLKVKGIELPDGSATISFPRIGALSWGPVCVKGNDGQLTVGRDTYKLNLKYYPDGNNTAQGRDAVLKFDNQTHGESALNHLNPRFDNGVFFERDGNVVRVGTARVALDAVDGAILRSYGRFESIKDALNTMKGRIGGLPYKNWRVSLLMDYQLTQDDLTTLKGLNADRGLDVLTSITFAGRQLDTDPIHTMSTGSITGANQDSTVPLRMPDNPHNTNNYGTNTVSPTHYILKDMNWNGFGIIAGNGNRMTIEGTWSGTGNCWLVGGSVRCFAADFPDNSENTRNYAAGQLTVRNTGSGWAGIAGGGMIAHNGTAQMSVSTYAANSLTVEAQNWGTTWGITPGNAYWAASGQKARAINTIHMNAGGASLTIRGNLTSGPINHSCIHNWTGGIDQGADVVNVNITMGNGFTWNGNLNDRNFGSLPTNKTHHLNVAIEGRVTLTTGNFYNFDELRVKAGGTLTIPNTGANVNHNAANARRSGTLVLENGASVVINGSCTGANDNLKLGSILLAGNGTLQFPKVGDQAYAPVEIAQGGTLTGTGHTLTVKYPDGANEAQIGDTLLKFVTQNNAATALPLVEKGFANSGVVSLIADSGLIKVSNGAVLLTWRDGGYGQYFDTLKNAIDDLESRTDRPDAASEKLPRARITFVENYTLSNEDVEALQNYSRPGYHPDGTDGDNYNKTILRLTSEFQAGARVVGNASWDSYPDVWKVYYPVPAGMTAGDTVRRTVTVPSGIPKIFLGAGNHEWEKLTLDFEGNTEIFACGNYLEVKNSVNMVGGNYPTLYGGGKDTVVPTDLNITGGTEIYNPHGNTTLKLNGGTWQEVYGGGKGTNAGVPGSTNITVGGAGLASGGAVYGGGKAGRVEGDTNVTINSGTATSGGGGAMALTSKIVAGGATGHVGGTARLTVNGGLSSAQVTLKGVEGGNAGSTDINVHLRNLPASASLVTLNVYAGPETEAKAGSNIPADNAVANSGEVGGTDGSGAANVTLWFEGQHRPNLGTVCGLKRDVTRDGNDAKKGTLTLKGDMTVKEVIFFDVLNIGVNNTSTGSVTVTGRLDSDPNKSRVQADGTVNRWPFDREGTLFLHGMTRLNLPDKPANMTGVPNSESGEAKVGKLKTDSNQAHLHIGRQKTTVNGEGRGTGATNPLYVFRGNYSDDLTAEKIRVGTPQGTPANGEILISFHGDLANNTTLNPQASHYITDSSGWNLGRNPDTLKDSDRDIAYWTGTVNVVNIIYTKSSKLMVEVTKVTPSRAEDDNMRDPNEPTHRMSWTVELEMSYWVTDPPQADGTQLPPYQDTTAQAPRVLYVDTNARHDHAWDPVTMGTESYDVPAGITALASATGGQITPKTGEPGVYTATITISDQQPFTYNNGGNDHHYFVHAKGEHMSAPSIRNIALDLHAPNLTSGLSSTSNGQGVTTFDFEANDLVPHNRPTGIPWDDETHSSYDMSNLTLVGWSTEEIRDGNQLDRLTVDYFVGLESAAAGQHQGGKLFYEAAGVQNATPCTFTVYKAKLPEKPGATNGEKVESVFLYLKDRLGNTRIREVPLSDHQLDLTIPTRVGVILVTNGYHTLSPICTITNKSVPSVRVELIGYTPKDGNRLRLSQTLGADAIGLTIRDSGQADGITQDIPVEGLPFRLTNTDAFTGGNPKDMGVLGPYGGTDNTLSFTFQGSFDQVQDLSTDWDLFYLTYRFTVPTANPNP